MNCEDCIHYEVCGATEQLTQDFIPCNLFKDKSCFVELPCKVGDKVYKLCTINSKITIGELRNGEEVKSNCDRCGYKFCDCARIGTLKHEHEYMTDVIVEKTAWSLEFIAHILPYFGKIWFASREEAEKKLEELEK